MQSIYYLSGGLLGDFIHQLSVIKENYIKTGMKGTLYIANQGDAFRHGLDTAYNDLKQIIESQDYIYEFKIYNNEKYNINLSAWRQSPLLYRANWHAIFHNLYSVDWGNNKWIDLPICEGMQNKILVCHSIHRWKSNFNYKCYVDTLDASKLLFIGISQYEYDNFVKNTGIVMPFHKCDSLYDLAICINSCEQFIGNLSSPLAFAYALHKKCIGIVDIHSPDYAHIRNLNDKLQFIEYI